MAALTSQYIIDTYLDDTPFALTTDLAHWARQGVKTTEQLDDYIDGEFLHNIEWRGTMAQYREAQIAKNIALAVARKRNARNAYKAPTLADLWPSGA